MPSFKEVVDIRKFIRINNNIRASQIRLIGPNSEQLGIVPLAKGLELASQHELDLVEVAAEARPPVCRIMDFAKFKYDQEKKEREAKRHQKQAQIKEIRVKPNIEEHDYQIKLRHAREFLEEGNKVKINLFFRGREMTHKELGKRILDQFITDLSIKGQLEKAPMLEGRTMSMVFAPNNKPAKQQVSVQKTDNT
ncbi:MAG: translation initiation factor IF-3 [Candidatus Omnitrophota bacterium]